ncbi:hypothetical protein CUN59_17480 [Cuspidothrix issatschenkoi CHARLIE-1]|uniref:Uncharacterized protein n=1 Tax=Cuspidothrix issatschenkoi CHARLIE-1 TaxID=2052836 RepID=A0A2S6CQN2_9CYAN|nr:hypothetical protein CUN59_17480 [Cuspidothrix issatschenkoi CHARLIE-1]
MRVGKRQEFAASIVPFIEKYSKQFQGWLLSDFNDLEKSISLESIGVELPIAEIYRGVVFEYLLV